MIDTASRHHLARVVFLYREGNFDRAVADFTAALGIDFGPVLHPAALGLRIAMSMAAGIEIVCPSGDEGYAPFMSAALDQRGEGFYGIVYRVPDLDEAVRSAGAAGWLEAGDRLDCFTANPAWGDTYVRMIEANMTPIAGINVTLLEALPKFGSAS